MKEKSPALSSPEHEGAGDGLLLGHEAFEGLHERIGLWFSHAGLLVRILENNQKLA
jgi:hypothetical protein